MVYTIHREILVRARQEEVFAFFADASNLEKLTPDLLRFKILSSLPIEMKAGAVIEYRLKVHGFPLRWRTRIETWNPPNQFSDLQLKGPYRLWHHTHCFRAAADGTWVTDDVRYALPFGILGRIVHKLQVRRDIEEIFDYRTRQLEAVWGRPVGTAGD